MGTDDAAEGREHARRLLSAGRRAEAWVALNRAGLADAREGWIRELRAALAAEQHDVLMALQKLDSAAPPGVLGGYDPEVGCAFDTDTVLPADLFSPEKAAEQVRPVVELVIDYEVDARDQDVGGLVALTTLTRLNIGGAKLTPVALRGLETLPALERLHVNSIHMTDGWIPQLTKFTGLRLLSLHPSRITGRGVAMLLSKLTALRELDLAGNWTEPTDDDAPLSSSSLRSLRLGGSNINDDNLGALAGLTALEELTLGSTPITDAGLEHLSVLPLRRLALSRTRVTGLGLRWLEGLPLQSLTLSYCAHLRPESLDSVMRMTSLKELGVHGLQATAGAVACLASMTWLRKLVVGYEMAEHHRDRLRRALPDTRVLMHD